ncbi:uncharacterized protein LOC144870141 [Branchiostoma floridae x Branchiostoma japonicum]
MLENRGLSLDLSLPSVEEVEEQEDSGQSLEDDREEDTEGSEVTSTEEMPSRINSAPACLSMSTQNADEATCVKEREEDEKEERGQEELDDDDRDNETETIMIANCLLDEMILKALKKQVKECIWDEDRYLEEDKDKEGQEESDDDIDKEKEEEIDEESNKEPVTLEKGVEEDKDLKEEAMPQTTTVTVTEETKEKDKTTVTEDQPPQMSVKPTKKVTILESPIEVHVIVNQGEDHKEVEDVLSTDEKEDEQDEECGTESDWETESNDSEETSDEEVDEHKHCSVT